MKSIYSEKNKTVLNLHKIKLFIQKVCFHCLFVIVKALINVSEPKRDICARVSTDNPKGVIKFLAALVEWM